MTVLSHGDPAKLGKIALFGAAGAVGHALAPLLARFGSYRVVGREIDKLRAFPNADAVRADFLSGEGLDAAAASTRSFIWRAHRIRISSSIRS